MKNLNILEYAIYLILIFFVGIFTGVSTTFDKITLDYKYLKNGKETIKLEGKEYRVKFIEIKRKEIIEEVE